MARLLMKSEFLQPWEPIPNFDPSQPVQQPPHQPDPIKVYAIDTPGTDGVSDLYSIVGFDLSKNEAYLASNPGLPYPTQINIVMQDKRVRDSGVNGVPDLALLEIVIDRVKGFQAGPLQDKTLASALQNLLYAYKQMAKFNWARNNSGPNANNILSTGTILGRVIGAAD